MKRYLLFLKIGLLVGLSLLIAFLLLKELYFTAVMCFIILLGTAFSLYQDQRKMLQKMEHLIANIHYGDMNLSFPIPVADVLIVNHRVGAHQAGQVEGLGRGVHGHGNLLGLVGNGDGTCEFQRVERAGLQHYVASHANDTPSEQRVIGFCRKLSETDSYSGSDAAVVSGFLSF